jgi:hypothetical protein
MFAHLTMALAELLHVANAPGPAREADISFDRPGDGYQPEKSSINLFLFDVRERADLRSCEPMLRRNADGMSATIAQPPLRMACSYLVTAWAEAGQSGQSATLAQHELLAAALQAFVNVPVLSADKLSGSVRDWLSGQPYPVELGLMQSEPNRNLSEFWSAVGGSLRPAFTLTATVAMVPGQDPVAFPLVRNRDIAINKLEPDASENKPARSAKRSNRR